MLLRQRQVQVPIGLKGWLGHVALFLQFVHFHGRFAKLRMQHCLDVYRAVQERQHALLQRGERRAMIPSATTFPHDGQRQLLYAFQPVLGLRHGCRVDASRHEAISCHS